MKMAEIKFSLTMKNYSLRPWFYFTLCYFLLYQLFDCLLFVIDTYTTRLSLLV